MVDWERIGPNLLFLSTKYSDNTDINVCGTFQKNRWREKGRRKNRRNSEMKGREKRREIE